MGVICLALIANGQPVAAGLTAAIVFEVTDVLGGGAVGPIAVTIILGIAC